MFPWLLPQLVFAMHHLNYGGHLIIRFPDILVDLVSDITFVLSSLFQETMMYKPNTSQGLSADVFLVCKGFFPKVKVTELQEVWLAALRECVTTVSYTRILTLPYPLLFRTKMDEIRTVFAQQHIENQMDRG